MLDSRLWIQAAWYDMFSVVFFLAGLSVLTLPLPILGLDSQSFCLGPVLCVCRPRQHSMICWEFDIFSGFPVFFLDDCLGGWSQWMWLVSCRRQGILTQEPNWSIVFIYLYEEEYFLRKSQGKKFTFNKVLYSWSLSFQQMTGKFGNFFQRHVLPGH